MSSAAASKSLAKKCALASDLRTMNARLAAVGERLFHGRICFRGRQQAQNIAVEVERVIFRKAEKVYAQQQGQ